MVHLGLKLQFGGLERVVVWKLDFEEEHTTLIWTAGRALQSTHKQQQQQQQ
jgi:hypothetical protein